MLWIFVLKPFYRKFGNQWFSHSNCKCVILINYYELINNINNNNNNNNNNNKIILINITCLAAYKGRR
jgi:hypothetical protein